MAAAGAAAQRGPSFAAIRTTEIPLLDRAGLAAVWLAVATSGFVYTEPCPTDAITIALAVLLPVLGLFYTPPLLIAFASFWMIAGAAALLAATRATDVPDAVIHSAVSIYLYIAAFTFAAFIAHRPAAHTRLILNAYLVAALVAAAAGVGGYLGIIPSADTFTKFGRASGTFKDPNVFGPFLVPAFLYCLHLALQQPLRRSFTQLTYAAFLGLAVFLSFSRGAWLVLGLALVIFMALSYISALNAARRSKIVILTMAGLLAVAGAIIVALQNDKVAALLQERASTSQSYDIGPEGRFGGQEKAFNLLLANPQGLGAKEFASQYHHEEPHNVYLSMPLNAGWLGGLTFTMMVGATIVIGFAQSLRRSPLQGYAIIATAAFTALMAEGVIIDLDHWRNVYLLMSIIWGIAGRRPVGQLA